MTQQIDHDTDAPLVFEAKVRLCGESAFLAVRHQYPDLIRQMRAALDVGANIDHLCCNNAIVSEALAHMRANPGAGCVIWRGMSFSWA